MNQRRDAILREMGLAPLWRLRAVRGAEEGVVAQAPLVPEQTPNSPGQQQDAQAPLAPGTTDAFVSPQHEPALRPVAQLTPASLLETATAAVRTSGDVAGLGWEALEARIHSCSACDLCKRRKRAVPGVGDRQADWLFVGEAPGAEEDERGEPFVGQAGRLLDNMLASIDLRRGQDVYIANAVKCRPPNNRTPESAELTACFPYLQRQIQMIRPRLIVALGRPAAQALLSQEVKIAAARGRLFDYSGIPIVVTYHPAYLLRNLQDKAKVWEDLCFARRTMARLKTDRPPE
ncbi:uracil-DNA glycosylase [Zoogloea sp.]|uniref:uracil-DNA glycosylase n=1 Tax=Zoogloea sp. TaxID=49181 RepID=UPI002634371E|nr:uracil-DNA glycosylase [Zoogloea sp.]MDD3354894.1 uracil-DNA glycosylase [Zoogloea sp.]